MRPQIPSCLNDIGNTHRLCSDIGDWGPTDVTECESYLVKYLAQQVLYACAQLELVQKFSAYAMASFFLLPFLNVTTFINF